jgi:phage-related protein
VKPVIFHSAARKVIRQFSKETRAELGSGLIKLQLGMSLGLPLSRPMSSVAAGVHELRFRDRSGIQRVFYVLKSADGVLVFHAFVKKTQATPESEIQLGRKRLLEMLDKGVDEP